MQKLWPPFLLFVAMSCILLTPPGFSNENDLPSVNGFNEAEMRSRIPPKQSPHPNDLPRLAFTEIPDIEITLSEEDNSHYVNRPELTGFPKSVFTEHFRIHFTTTGEDAVPDLDENRNNIPDYVEEVAKAMEYVWEVEINYFGWPAPPTDGGKGGDDRYDVYLEDLSETDFVGYAEPTSTNYIVEGNKIIKDLSAPSYISMDKDFNFPNDKSSSLLHFMRVAAAHEFFHAIQFGFDSTESLAWLPEATANWMEDEVFDGIDDVDYWLEPVFDSPDTCMASQGGSDEDRRYALWIFPRFLSEKYGHSIVQDLWYSAIELDGYRIVESTLEARQLNPQTVIEDYLIALLLRDFDEGEKYPTISLEGRVRRGEMFIPPDGVDKLGADYIEILGRGKLSISLESDQLKGIVVGINGKQSAIYYMADETVSVNANKYDHLYLIIINPNKVSFAYQCEIVNYQVEVNRGGEVQYQPLLRPAPNFHQP